MPEVPQRSSRPSAAHQHILREQNLGVVADAVLTAPEPVSRADVADSTGLARATVSILVDRLVAGGIVAELPPVALGGAGRPAVPLVPAARTFVGLGVEVSSAGLGALAVDLTDDVVAERVVPGDFRGQPAREVFAEVGALARTVVAECRAAGMTVAGVRLALPGLVNSATGELRVAPNLGWESIHPAPLLGLGELPVVIANGTKLAALAALKDTPEDAFVFLHSEGGIGGAFVVERRLARGDAEFGHCVVDPSGPKCSCGANGCLEQYAGKQALMTAAGFDPAEPIERLVAAVEADEPQAVAAVRGAAWALGHALGNTLNVVDVSLVLLGGALSVLAPLFHDDVLRIMNERVLSARFVPLELRAAAVRTHPAMLGGALAVLRDVANAPGRWV